MDKYVGPSLEKDYDERGKKGYYDSGAAHWLEDMAMYDYLSG